LRGPALVPVKCHPKRRAKGGAKWPVGGILLLNVLDERRENDIAHVRVAIDESSLKDGQHQSGRPIGNEPAGDVRHVDVGEELAVVGEVLPKDGVECWLSAEKLGEERRNRCHSRSVRYAAGGADSTRRFAR